MTFLFLFLNFPKIWLYFLKLKPRAQRPASKFSRLLQSQARNFTGKISPLLSFWQEPYFKTVVKISAENFGNSSTVILALDGNGGVLLWCPRVNWHGQLLFSWKRWNSSHNEDEWATVLPTLSRNLTDKMWSTRSYNVPIAQFHYYKVQG